MGVSKTASLGLINLLKQLIEQRETFTFVYQLTLKDIIEDTDESPDKKHGAQKSAKLRSFYPLRTGVNHPPEFTNQPGSSSNLVVPEFL